MTKAVYDPAPVSEQLVGLTASQTLTNKTLTSPVVNTPTGIVTSDLTESTNKNFVTDTDVTNLGNLSNTNSGDNATNTQYSGLTQYTDEMAQDAVGGMVDGSLTYTD